MSLLGCVEELGLSCSRLGADPKAAGRVLRHIVSQLACLGRHTITGQLATAGRQFVDWSADYRLYSQARVAPDEMFAGLQQAAVELLPRGHPVVVALDDTRVKKWSRRTPGVQYFRDPLGPKFRLNLLLGQRFVQQSLAVSDGQGRARLVPVSFSAAPAPAKPRRTAAAEHWCAYRQALRDHSLAAVGAQQLRLLRQHLDSSTAGRGRRLVSLVDGSYTNGRFLGNLPDSCAVIGRIRGDAKLYHLPDSQPAAGRRRIYGAAAPTPEQLRQDSAVAWQTITIQHGPQQLQLRVKTLAALRWRTTGAKHLLRVVVIAPLGYRLTRAGKQLYRKPAYLICTAPDLPVQEIVQYYVWRWGIEVNFRDEKTLFGVGQAEVHHPNSVERVPALQVLAYGILLLAAVRTYGLHDMQLTLPAPRWRNKPPQQVSSQQLLNQLRHDLWSERLHFSDFAAHSVPQTKCEKLYWSPAPALFYGAARA
jgi:hypothetical protein